MNAFHTLWTRPGCGILAEKYQLYTMVLSALKWRSFNGDITLVTDSKGRDMIVEMKLSDVWNDIVTELDDIPGYIKPQTFWAAGKIYALRNRKAPVVSMDTDFIVWSALELEKAKTRLCVIHKETLNSTVYPDSMPYIEFDDGFSWSALPVNAAFMYIADKEFIERYTGYADMFMRSCPSDDRLRPMVFAEQRLFSMTAEKLGIPVDTFSTLERLAGGGDDRFTHIWGYKRQLETDADEKSRFTERLRSRIIKDYPHMEGII